MSGIIAPCVSQTVSDLVSPSLVVEIHVDACVRERVCPVVFLFVCFPAVNCTQRGITGN